MRVDEKRGRMGRTRAIEHRQNDGKRAPSLIFAEKHDMHADPLKRVPLWILQSFNAALSRF